ncbi:MAG: PAS domain-containing protein [Nitrospirae bacterium]|nr:PAS domain-containing protein [Nitrospirota bacterium]
MFQNNLDIIYFIYGSSFVIMGIVVLRQPKEGSTFKLAGILWLLAGFGISHGINEWLEMWAILKGGNKAIDLLQWFCLTTSYAFLFEFGRRTIRVTGQSSQSCRKFLIKYLDWRITLCAGIIVFLFSVLSHDLLKTGSIAARYTLGFPGSILTAYGFIAYYVCEKDMLSKVNVRIPFLLSGVAFLLYAVLSGLIVPEGDFFPANWLNESSFLSVSGIPVSFFRAGVAVGVTIAVMEILNIFNLEAKNKLQYEILALLKAVPDRIILLSPDLTIVWANTSAIEPVSNRLNTPEITQQHCYRLYFDRLSACPDCHTLTCFDSGEVQYNQRTDPRGKIWDIRAVPIKNQEGKTINVIELSCDVTEKITMQKNAITARHLTSLGEISAGVAHEINNPINSIINCAQLIADKSENNLKIHEYSIGIILEAERIASIVRSLLSFARESKSEKIVTDIYTPLNEILSIAGTQMRKEGIALIVDLPDGLPYISANKQQLQQVFLNITSNSRYALNEKYNGKHKDKILKITGKEYRTNETSYLRLQFIDYGTGIPPNILEKVKEPFFSTKPVGKGTGLGLSISHGIINDHNGRLDIESSEGQYACVNIELPAVVKEEKDSSTNGKTRPPVQNGK